MASAESKRLDGLAVGHADLKTTALYTQIRMRLLK
jgi:hypothetical protein